METRFSIRAALSLSIIAINFIYCFPVIETLGHGTGYSVQRVAAVLLLSSGLSFIAFGYLISVLTTFSDYSMVVKFFYSIFLFWCLFVIANSVSMDLGATWQLFNRADGAGPWIIPLIMLLGGQVTTWQRLNRVFVLHTAIGIACAVIVVLFFKNEMSAFRPFAFFRFGMLYAGGFLLLTWHYQRNFARMAGLIGIVSYGFIAFLASARHGLITTLYVLLTFLFLRQLQVEGVVNKLKGIYLTVFGVIALVVISIVAVNYSGYVQGRYLQFEKKLTQDSRSVVITEFVNYAENSPYLVTGSGALGTYKTRLFYHTGVTKRGNIENGYLQLVHKGGIVMLVLFLLLVYPAAFMAIFFSCNWFTRITGFMVFGRLIDMVPYGIPWTDPSYILFWLCVGACLNPRFRRMSDAEVSLYPVVPERA